MRDVGSKPRPNTHRWSLTHQEQPTKNRTTSFHKSINSSTSQLLATTKNAVAFLSHLLLCNHHLQKLCINTKFSPIWPVKSPLQTPPRFGTCLEASRPIDWPLDPTTNKSTNFRSSHGDIFDPGIDSLPLPMCHAGNPPLKSWPYFLVGDFNHPPAKYARQIGSFPPHRDEH